MTTLTKPFTFTGGTFAVASQVNSDFDTVFNWINTNAIWSDASRAFTAVPTGPGTDPSSANQLARKSYVDQKVGAQQIPGSSGQILKWGRASVSTDANGIGNCAFPAAFPTSCDGAIVVSGNISDSLMLSINTTTTTFISVRITHSNTGGPFVSSSIFVYYLAAGH